MLCGWYLIIEAKNSYARLLCEIASSGNQPLVYHCSHGVHRSGPATAILSALGEPWETAYCIGLLDKYIRKGLGITDQEFVSLREQLLEPVK